MPDQAEGLRELMKNIPRETPAVSDESMDTKVRFTMANFMLNLTHSENVDGVDVERLTKASLKRVFPEWFAIIVVVPCLSQILGM